MHSPSSPDHETTTLKRFTMNLGTAILAVSFASAALLTESKPAVAGPLAHCNEMENINVQCQGENGKIYPSRIVFCRAQPNQPGCGYINRTY